MDLIKAVAAGDYCAVSRIIEFSKSSINTRDRSGNTPLILAVINNEVKIVEILIKAGAFLDMRSSDGMTALDYAAMYMNFAVACLLLGAGASARKGALEYLLCDAASCGHMELINKLIKIKNINVNVLGSQGYNALMGAAKYGHNAVVSVLLQTGVNVNAEDLSGRTALHYAVAAKQLKTACTLINAGASIGIKLLLNDVLIYAAGFGDVKTVEVVLQRFSTNVNAVNRQGCTALMQAVKFGFIDVVHVLLRSTGIDIRAKDNTGKTALQYAIEKNDARSIRLLSSVKVGYPAHSLEALVMHLAVVGNELAICGVLRSLSVDVNAGDSQGRTVLMQAIMHGHSMVAARLLKYPATNLNIRDDFGKTALDYALAGKQLDVAYEMIKLGARSTDIYLLSLSLCYVAELSHRKLFNVLINVPGIDVSVRDNFGRTALMYASINRDIYMVSRLVSMLPGELVRLEGLHNVSACSLATKKVSKYLIYSGKVLSLPDNVCSNYTNASKMLSLLLAKVSVEYCDDNGYSFLTRIQNMLTLTSMLFPSKLSMYTRLLVAKVCGVSFPEIYAELYGCTSLTVFNATSYLMRSAKLTKLLYSVVEDNQYLQLYILMLQANPYSNLGMLAFKGRSRLCSFLVGEYSGLGGAEIAVIENASLIKYQTSNKYSVKKPRYRS